MVLIDMEPEEKNSWTLLRYEPFIYSIDGHEVQMYRRHPDDHQRLLERAELDKTSYNIMYTSGFFGTSDGDFGHIQKSFFCLLK